MNKICIHAQQTLSRPDADKYRGYEGYDCRELLVVCKCEALKQKFREPRFRRIFVPNIFACEICEFKEPETKDRRINV